MDAWIFGYGSLVWRPDIPFLEARPARLRGFVRRFWQGSPDHRGTPEAPGRVVTLVPAPEAWVDGLAYRVEPSVAAEVMAALDVREQAGYQRLRHPVVCDDGVVEALVYFAAEGNPSWLGPAPLVDMAAHIARSAGPSGPNAAYVVELDRALKALGVVDDHVAALAEAVRAVGSA